jgi:hypothetical protein
MSDDRGTNSTPAGLYLGTQKQPILMVEWFGIALAILWLGVSAYVLLNNVALGAGILTSILLFLCQFAFCGWQLLLSAHPIA